ncbi:hypothetical protein [Spirosoma endbachense]|uniref:Uncharacterized protein n=1 Tax=Spirosoma endbachense TaxID=2666025 RepID=A0A6P1W998_9BACT|nr:hypothetical protein [Spirosoma endbachense]QHW00481.1 hypothetical protein GJR95_38080 [Spirosoma endbachense]
MTPSQRRRLIEKRQRGTLTEEENQQYQELLRTDSSFYDDVNMHAMLTDVSRRDAGQELWEAAGKARAKARKRSTVLATVWRHPYAYAMAACVSLLIVGVWVGGGDWLRNLFTLPNSTPQIVKSEKRDVRLLTDNSTMGYDDYGGSIWIQWKRNQQQKIPQAYTFCRDTLTVFLKNPQDTAQWQSVGLRFNSEKQILYVSRLNKPLLPLLECTQAPQSLPFSP